VSIVKSSGHSELDHAATKAAKKDVYEPAKQSGKAVPFELTVKYAFRLTDDR
jgi:TonB family protein